MNSNIPTKPSIDGVTLIQLVGIGDTLYEILRKEHTLSTGARESLRSVAKQLADIIVAVDPSLLEKTE